jgi:hypothetical protein
MSYLDDERTVDQLGRALEAGMGGKGTGFEALKIIAEHEADEIRRTAFTNAGLGDCPTLEEYRARVKGIDQLLVATAEVIKRYYDQQRGKGAA